ncbi:MAG: hypothetical protein ACM3S1_07420 [Hyphomicrobiales bacterium]
MKERAEKEAKTDFIVPEERELSFREQVGKTVVGLGHTAVDTGARAGAKAQELFGEAKAAAPRIAKDAKELLTEDAPRELGNIGPLLEGGASIVGGGVKTAFGEVKNAPGKLYDKLFGDEKETDWEKARPQALGPTTKEQVKGKLRQLPLVGEKLGGPEPAKPAPWARGTERRGFIGQQRQEHDAEANEGLGTAAKVVGGAGRAAKPASKVVKKFIPADQRTVTSATEELREGHVWGTNPITGGDIQTGRLMKIDEVGLDMPISAVTREAGGLATTAGSVLKLVSAIDQHAKGDPAQQVMAEMDIVEGIFNIAKGASALGRSSTNLAGAFGGEAMANAIRAGAELPGFAIATAAIKLTEAADALYVQAKRAQDTKSLLAEAEKKDAKVASTALRFVRGRAISLATHASVDLVGNAVRIVAEALTISGLGAVAGMPLKMASFAIIGINKVAKKAVDEYRAQKLEQARADFYDNKEGAAEKLLELDPKHAAQTLVTLGRQGDPIALQALEGFGLSRRDFDLSSDKNVRDLILARLGEKENLKTVQKLLEEKSGKVKQLLAKPQQAKELAELKNRANYGGKHDRGKGWMVLNLIGGDIEEQRRHIEQFVREHKDLTEDEKYRVLTGRDPMENKAVHHYTDAELILLLLRPNLPEINRRLFEGELERRKYRGADSKSDRRKAVNFGSRKL